MHVHFCIISLSKWKVKLFSCLLFIKQERISQELKYFLFFNVFYKDDDRLPRQDWKVTVLLLLLSSEWLSVFTHIHPPNSANTPVPSDGVGIFPSLSPHFHTQGLCCRPQQTFQEHQIWTGRTAMSHAAWYQVKCHLNRTGLGCAEWQRACLAPLKPRAWFPPQKR